MRSLVTDRNLACCSGSACAVLPCDADAPFVHRLSVPHQIPLIGGGGTDLRTGFARARRTRPDAVVVLTDGETPWPERRPAGRTVVGLFSRRKPDGRTIPANLPEAPPAWARVVDLGSIGG